MMNQNNNKEVRVHKVGTLTLGITLVFFGAMFLLRHFFTGISYSFILHLWPIVLVILGVEVLLGTKKESFEFSKGAVFLAMILCFWAMGMGVCEYIFEATIHYHI